jgi:hypothetical protein
LGSPDIAGNLSSFEQENGKIRTGLQIFVRTGQSIHLRCFFRICDTTAAILQHHPDQVAPTGVVGAAGLLEKEECLAFILVHPIAYQQ